MMHIFVTKPEDKLYELQGNSDLYLRINEEYSYSLYRVSDTKAYVLKPNFSSSNNKAVLEKQGISKLYDLLKENFPNEPIFVIAIHWGGIDTFEESQKLCKSRLDELEEENPEIGEKVKLTYYSGRDEFIAEVNEANDIHRVIEEINRRIGWQEESDVIKMLYVLKENLLRTLFPLTLGQSVSDNEINGINSYIKSAEGAIGSGIVNLTLKSNILKTGDNKISIVLKSDTEQGTPSPEKYNAKLKELRKYLNELIDQQLSTAGRETIYGD